MYTNNDQQQIATAHPYHIRIVAEMYSRVSDLVCTCIGNGRKSWKYNDHADIPHYCCGNHVIENSLDIKMFTECRDGNMPMRADYYYSIFLHCENNKFNTNSALCNLLIALIPYAKHYVFAGPVVRGKTYDMTRQIATLLESLQRMMDSQKGIRLLA